ncbi:MAG: hypothetical protein F6K54_33825 [Okeania sp. SIO3B5]|uniref:DUF6208 family protein n=1 Tax=Okeania sp. SIO3B5 TaxID=2607811 RepID=UPI001400C31B|nr:DUF6208 family protein [Okeania sp. SIO3B5]NEO57614.1 hypothetical protein [Okeania sp. SIO3B5]
MKNREKILAIELLWEVPLALLSFIFFKIVKLLIHIIISITANSNISITTNSNKKEFNKWQVISEEALKKPLTLPYILTHGPRWNTSAIVAVTTRPFVLKKSLAIEISSCVASAQSWSIGIYTYPEVKPVEYIASYNSNLQEQWHELKLEPGKYTLVLRYYNWYDQVNFPVINVDGNLIIESESVDGSNVNNFYQNLITRDNIFYRFLNYYIFTLLICQKWLPKEWVRKEYLPIGDPNNEFLYGFVYKGCSLSLELNSLLLANYDVYLTTYSRSSLPITFCQINAEKYMSKVIETDGFYLLRLRYKSDLGNNLFQQDWINVELLSSQGDKLFIN